MRARSRLTVTLPAPIGATVSFRDRAPEDDALIVSWKCDRAINSDYERLDARVVEDSCVAAVDGNPTAVIDIYRLGERFSGAEISLQALAWQVALGDHLPMQRRAVGIAAMVHTLYSIGATELWCRVSRRNLPLREYCCELGYRSQQHNVMTTGDFLYVADLTTELARTFGQPPDVSTN
jgi:hypothetical protein